MFTSRHHTMFCAGECSDLTPVKHYCMGAHHFIYAHAVPCGMDELEFVRHIADIAPGGCLMYTKVDNNMYELQLEAGVTLTCCFSARIPYAEEITAVFVPDGVERLDFHQFPKLEVVCCTPDNFEDVCEMDLPKGVRVHVDE